MTGLKALIAKALRLPSTHPVSDTMAMADTRSWDSLAHMELVFAIEDRYHFSLSTDDIVAMTSVKGIVTVLRSHGVDLQCD
jgi:acyl carrier protein